MLVVPVGIVTQLDRARHACQRQFALTVDIVSEYNHKEIDPMDWSLW